jgi:hypothetical protein
MKDQPPILDINIHSDSQAEPRKLSSLTLYIDLWQEGKPAPGKDPPVISPPVVIFRRIGVRAEARTQNPVLSNTRLAKMVPLSHLRRLTVRRDAHLFLCFSFSFHLTVMFTSMLYSGFVLSRLFFSFSRGASSLEWVKPAAEGGLSGICFLVIFLLFVICSSVI